MRRLHCIVYGLFDPRPHRKGELRYVGKSIRGVARTKEKHCAHCAFWMRAVRAVGLEPEVEILFEGGSPGELAEEERRVIGYFRFIGADLTNLTDGGEGIPGFKQSAAQRANISKLNRLRGPRSAETRAKIAAAHKGMKPSQATRDKQSAAHRARKRAPHSAETRARIAASHQGKKHGPHSAETRAKIGLAQIGKRCPPVSAETRALMSAQRKGRKHSPETRAKIAAANRRRARKDPP